MENIILFEAEGLLYLNLPISDQDLTILRQVILNLTRLEEETKSQNIFMSVEKNKDRNYILFCKKIP